MPLPPDHETLSTGDALFLHLEREGMPLNVAVVATLDGVVDFENFAAYVESRLPMIPRYLQRVVAAPFYAGLPMWEYDPDFDVHNHIHQVELRNGTEREFKTAAAKILSRVLDRARPLWDLTLVRGLRGNRTGVVARAHHCLADGISGVGLLKLMMEEAPTAFVAPAGKPRLRVPRRDAANHLLESFATSVFASVDRVLTLESELLEFAHRLARPITNGHTPQANSNGNGENGNHDAEHANGNGAANPLALDQWSGLLTEFAAPAQRLPFNVVCRGPQKFEWTSIPLDEMKQVKRACGATVNDVVLAVVTAALQRYARLHRVNVRGRALKIVMPVSVRGRADAAELGNRITFVPIAAPLDARQPCKLVKAIHTKTTQLKSTHLAEIVGFAGSLLGNIPPVAQAILGPIASQLPLSVCNVICTNVPGPRLPLYLLGHKIEAFYPYVPIGGEMGMNCAVFTYDGTAFFGFTGDAQAIPDLALLPKFLEQSFAELKKALPIGSSAKRIRRREVRRRVTLQARADSTIRPTSQAAAEIKTRESNETREPMRAAAAVA